MKYKITQSLIVVDFVRIFVCIFVLKFYKYMPMNNRNIVQSNVFVRWLRLPPSRLGHSSELDGLAAQSAASATLLKQVSKTK